MLKKKIHGVRCKLESQREAFHDEMVVSVNGTKLILKKRYVGFLEPEIKYAVNGESNAFIYPEGLIEMIGPTRAKDYEIKLNCRGYMHKTMVNFRDILWNDVKI